MVNTRKKFEGYSRGRIVIAVVLGAIAKPILDNGASRPLKYSDQVISNDTGTPTVKPRAS